MSSASPSSDVQQSWRCAPCAAFAGVDYTDPAAVTARCADCGASASPCAVLLREVGDLRDEIRELRTVALATLPLPDTDEPMLTATEAAAHMKLPSKKALYARVKRLTIPAHRFGSRGLRFKRSELDAVLEARR